MFRHLTCLLLALATQPFAAEDRFRIRIDLDEDTAVRLLKEETWISVEAGYYGEVPPGAPEDDWGRVRLGYEEFTVFPASQVMAFGGSLVAMPVERVKEPRVSIRVTTAGAPEVPELLLCDYIDRSLAGLVEDEETLIECMLRED